MDKAEDLIDAISLSGDDAVDAVGLLTNGGRDEYWAQATVEDLIHTVREMRDIKKQTNRGQS